MNKLMLVGVVLVGLLLSGCDLLSEETIYSPAAYEQGLRAGQADAPRCDHPFPRASAGKPILHTFEHLRMFEYGYYKGCALARESVKPVAKKPLRPRSTSVGTPPDYCKLGS